MKSSFQPAHRRVPAKLPRAVRRPIASSWHGGSWALSLSSAATVALGQAYFDARNPFTAPVPPEPAEEPVATRAGDDFTANERLPYRPAGFDPGSYNLKLGPVVASFGAGLTTTYTSNALQTRGTGDSYDLSLNPGVNANLRWQVTDAARLSLGFGIGYRFHFVQDRLNGLSLSPNTSVDYAFSVGDVLFTVFDRVSTATQAGERADLIGSGDPLAVKFNRLNNSTGLSAEWAPYTDLSLSGDYTFSLERSLGDSYSLLNGESQSLALAVFNRLSPAVSVGVSASAALNDYANTFQNSSKSFGIGPTATWKPSDYLNVSASMRYTVVNSDRGGQIRDSSSFSGLTGSLSIGHRLNRVLNHGLSFGRSVNGALGSNYGDSLEASYHFSWDLTDSIPLNFSASYQRSEQSGGMQVILAPPEWTFKEFDPAFGSSVLLTPFGPLVGAVRVPGGTRLFGIPSPGQVSSTYRFGVSTGYQLTRHLNSSLSWGYHIRSTDFAFGSYNSHSVTLTLSYQF